MSEEVEFIRGNGRINRLAARPDIADEVAQIRADMAEADRTYAMGLAALRQAAELTQVELARRMGVTQAAISRMEQPHDLLLSTLNSSSPEQHLGPIATAEAFQQPSSVPYPPRSNLEIISEYLFAATFSAPGPAARFSRC